MKDFSSVQEWVEFHRNTKVNAFYPTAVAKALNISQSEADKELIALVEKGKLKLRYQCVCDCGHTLENDVIPASLPREFMCDQCGQEFEINKLNQLQKLFLLIK